MAAVSSLANGADALFLEEAGRRKLPFWVVLPFLENRYEKNFDAETWRRLQSYLVHALAIERVYDAHTVDEAYMEAGERVASQADVLIAVWNGKPVVGLGGTGDVVEFARKLGKPLIWINPESGQLVEERLDLLLAKKDEFDRSQNPRDILQNHFSGLDNAASRHGPKSRRLILLVILFHLMASAVGLTIPTLDLHGTINYAIVLFELVFLAAAFFMTFTHHRRREDWMKTRIEAEICRSYLATWQMRNRVNLFSKSAIQGFESIFKSVRLFQLLDVAPPPTLSVAKTDYLKNRVFSQLAYFRQQTQNANVAYHKIKKSALLCTAIATFSTAGLLALIYFHLDGWALHLTKLLSLVLPLVSAALISVILSREYSRRATRYMEMVAFLENMAQQVEAIKTQNGLANLATECERKLLQEIAEWHSYIRFTGE